MERMSVDVEAIRARARQRRTTLASAARGGEAESDLEALLRALEEAHGEIRQVVQDHDELRESAEIWIRLYVGNVNRANRAEADVSDLRSELPRHVQDLYERLDRVALLSDAINDVVRECEACARDADSSVSATRVDACPRCQKALEALKSTANLAGSPL